MYINVIVSNTIEIRKPSIGIETPHNIGRHKVLKERFYHPDVHIVVFKCHGVKGAIMVLPLNNAVMNALQENGYSVFHLRANYGARR